MLKKKKYIIALLLIPQIALIKWLSNYPEFIETYYSNGLYPIISKLFRYLLGWLPFSFGDLLYAFVIIYAVRWLFINRKRIVNDSLNWFIDIAATASIIYFAFHVLWGMNYYRLPVHEKLDLPKEYTTEALIKTAQQLINKVNDLQLQLASNDSIKIKIPYTKSEILKTVPAGYKELSKKYAYLTYKAPSIKKSLLSLPLTYMGFSGYLNPITNEAQVDGLIPEFKFPTTASHEVAHQLGYAAENEANFIGCLATVNHEDLYFNYCGYAFALRHCLGEIYRRNPEKYTEIIGTVNKGTIKNYQEVRDFWDQYKNPLEPIFHSTYNSFLKANNQKGGMKSYSYVVALLVNYFEKHPIKKVKK